MYSIPYRAPQARTGGAALALPTAAYGACRCTCRAAARLPPAAASASSAQRSSGGSDASTPSSSGRVRRGGSEGGRGTGGAGPPQSQRRRPDYCSGSGSDSGGDGARGGSPPPPRLSDSQLLRWERDGFLVTRRCLPPADVAALKPEVEAIIESRKLEALRHRCVL